MIAVTFPGVEKMYSLCWRETNNFFYRFNIEINIDIHDGSALFLTATLPFGDFRVTFSQPVQRSILAVPLEPSLCQYRFRYRSQ